MTFGLINDEENFLITPNDDLNAPFPTENICTVFSLGAYLNNELVGVVSFLRDGGNYQEISQN